jgi:hypothetical protein
MSTGMKHFVLGVLAAIALTGCPDPGEGGGGNDPSALVGSWTQVTEPGEDGETIELRADNTYSLDGPEGSESGTFDADSRTLTLTSDTGSVSEMPYIVEGDEMLGIGLKRDAATAGAGFIGDWHADGIEDGDTVSIDLSVRADGTVEIEVPDDGGTLVLTGTWTEDAGALVTAVTLGGQGSLEIKWHTLRDALGAPLYARD